MNDKNSYLSPFPRRLRLLIDETRVSQQEIADHVGVTRQAVSHWKDGKTIPDCFSFKKLAEFFKVPLEYLYGDTESKVRENQALVDSLGFSDFSVQKLQHWAKLPFFGMLFTELLSQIIDTDDFNSFMIQAQSVVEEYAEHQLDLEQIGVRLYHEDDEIQARARHEVGRQARALGIRTIRTENLTAFYRQRAMESIGQSLNEVAKQYYEKHRERLIEERLEGGETDTE